ncbi:MAG: DUF2147 domain-containing protein [Alphaproteobacteria bacterium]|nr:DUF2147 domain-containing protein [Alphaproteobacteria bacterium]
MKRLFATAAISAGLAFASGSALAAEPSLIGDWQVKDGYGNIRIDNCNGKMWGILVWEKAPGFDKENPDPAKKGRPLLGTPVLMGLAPAKEPGHWTGEIYNSNDGKLYGATISLADEDTLNLQGCLGSSGFSSWLCQTQQWTRVKTPPPNASPLPPIKGTAPQSKQAAAKKGAAAPGVSDTCQRVAAEEAASQTNAKK